MTTLPKVKTYCCVFCKGMVSMPLQDMDTFKSHMTNVHRNYFEFDMLLMCNFINKQEQEELFATINKRITGIQPQDNIITNEAENHKNLTNSKLTTKDTKTKKQDKKVEQTDKETQTNEIKQDNKFIKRERTTLGCDKCQYKTKYKQNLHLHEKLKHEGLMLDGFSCSYCDYQTKQKHNLLVHQQSKHEGVKYNCELCDYKGSKYGLKGHMKSKHEGKSFSCDHCIYESPYLSALVSHKKAKHDGVTYDCDKCDYTTSWRHGLGIHKERNHGENVCNLCDFGALSQEKLKKHKKIKHKNNFSEVCDICDFGAHSQEKLKKHKQVKHKNNFCEICDSKVTHLKRHMKTTHRDAKYHCNLCDFTCSLNKNLINHKRQKHTQALRKNLPQTIEGNNFIKFEAKVVLHDEIKNEDNNQTLIFC